jgi:hypothetical protein
MSSINEYFLCTICALAQLRCKKSLIMRPYQNCGGVYHILRGGGGGLCLIKYGYDVTFLTPQLQMY